MKNDDYTWVLRWNTRADEGRGAYEAVQIPCISRFTFPFPPSVNSYWGTRIVYKTAWRGKKAIKKPSVQRYIDKKGQIFRGAVEDYFYQNPVREILTQSLQVKIDLYPPTEAVRDQDNYQKGLLDALTHCGVWRDDTQVKRALVTMHPKSSQPRCEIRLFDFHDLQNRHSQADLALMF